MKKIENLLYFFKKIVKMSMAVLGHHTTVTVHTMTKHILLTCMLRESIYIPLSIVESDD